MAFLFSCNFRHNRRQTEGCFFRLFRWLAAVLFVSGGNAASRRFFVIGLYLHRHHLIHSGFDFFFHAFRRTLIFLRHQSLHFLIVKQVANGGNVLGHLRIRGIGHAVRHIGRTHNEGYKEKKHQKRMASLLCRSRSPHPLFSCHGILLMYEIVIIEFIFYIIAYGRKRFRASKDSPLRPGLWPAAAGRLCGRALKRKKYRPRTAIKKGLPGQSSFYTAISNPFSYPLHSAASRRG